MIVLGIDPGLATTGWGVIKKTGRNISAVDFGTVETAAGLPLAVRIRVLYEDVQKIISDFKPGLVCVERLFFNTNAKTALIVGQARGVIMLAAAQNDLKVIEFTPLQIKINTTGYGKAEKLQVQKMVKELLNLEAIPKPDDAADALAVALCGAHYQSRGLEK